MGRSVNKVILVGNMGIMPELKIFGDGLKCARFSLATSRQWLDKQGNKKEDTQWHRLIAWNKIAEIVEKYCKKGSKLYVEGEINNKKWTDKNGVEKHTTEILIKELIILDKRESNFGLEDAPSAEGFFCKFPSVESSSVEGYDNNASLGRMLDSMDSDMPF